MLSSKVLKYCFLVVIKANHVYDTINNKIIGHSFKYSEHIRILCLHDIIFVCIIVSFGSDNILDILILTVQLNVVLTEKSCWGYTFKGQGHKSHY